MNYQEYIRLSLELHLFFDRIMKEHSFFLETAFMPKDGEFRVTANNFQKTFADILENVIYLADGNVNEEFLSANEMVTSNTLLAENQTAQLSGIKIDTTITKKEINLKSGNIDVNEILLDNIRTINRQTISVVQNLIQFKSMVLNEVLSCRMYTTNYPLLITHIMNEAKMYFNLLNRLETGEPFTEHYIYEQELFWNNIMKEHAEFIRGLLDPSEETLIQKAHQFAQSYEEIIDNYSTNPIYLTNISLQQTIGFQKFKLAGEEGILNCKIKSIIVPLLADHVLREANHFIRILQSVS